MGEMLESANKDQEVYMDVQKGDLNNNYISPSPSASTCASASASLMNIPFAQKMIAEVLGTYFLVFVGCAAIIVNSDKNHVITLPGMAIVCGLAVMVMVYSIGHISGCHINPAVTIAFAVCGRFPWKQVLPYIASQVLGSILANGSLRLIFNGKEDYFAGSSPSGSDLQSLIIEFIITFYLMFVVSGVATDNRAIGELAGLAIGATVLLNVIIAGPVSSASMNPARSIGSAILWNHYKGIWIYIVGPTSGAICGALVYNLIRFTDKPLRELTKSGSFLKSMRSREIVCTSNLPYK
ncbi:Aquaporin NIP1-1 [Dionaea muscipula]